MIRSHWQQQNVQFKNRTRSTRRTGRDHQDEINKGRNRWQSYWILGSHDRNTLKYPSLVGELGVALISHVCTAYYSVMLVICFTGYFLVCIGVFGGL